jgi:hypothetical protein
MTTARNPLVLGLAALLLLVGVLYLVDAGGTDDTDTSGAGFSAAEREALGAAPVDRGAAGGGADPAVDLRDPTAVASAYVAAGYSLRADDAGRTNRRAVPYAAPGTPPAEVGVLVVSPPPPGQRTSAIPDEVTLLGADETDTRRGYLVGYRSTTVVGSGPPAGGPDQPRSRYLLMVRQFDGRWLVAADSAEAQVGEP